MIQEQPSWVPTKGTRQIISWGFRRQFLYFLLFLFIVVFVGQGIYERVLPSPTCNDGRKNKDETGIDCGGACARVCPNEVEDLRVEWSKVFPSSYVGQYDVAALVLNPNLAYGLARLNYRFTLFDTNNKLVAEREGETYVNPGERVVLYEPSIATGNRVPIRAYVQFNNLEQELPWRRAILPLRPVLSVENSQLQIKTDLELIGQLANRSMADAIGIQTIAVLLDKDQAPVGIRSSYLDSLQRNNSVPLLFSWGDFLEKNVPRDGEIYPRTSVEGIK